MWRPLVLLAVVAFAAADEHQGALPGLRSAFEPRLGASAIRIAVLEKHLKDLDHDIEEARKINPSGFVEQMHSELDDHEAPVCADKHDVYCGRHSVECISSLLMCDGVSDCHNGWDESEETCSPGPIKAGNIFHGTATWHNCLTHDPHPVEVHIEGTYRANFFRARLGVRAHIDLDFHEGHEHHSIPAKGYYVFGKKYLVLVPRDTHARRHREYLGVVCKFNLGDNERASCQIVVEASLHECASFMGVLKH